jgi:hypothetical protein
MASIGGIRSPPVHGDRKVSRRYLECRLHPRIARELRKALAKGCAVSFKATLQLALIRRTRVRSA